MQHIRQRNPYAKALDFPLAIRGDLRLQSAKQGG